MNQAGQQNGSRPNPGTANIGVVGMAVMGSNLARNLASRKGNTVAIYNRSPERTRGVISEHPEAGFVASESIEDFVASLAKPRTAIIMVQAGRGTDAVIARLADLFEPATSSSTAATPTSPTRSAASATCGPGTSTSSARASPAVRRAPSRAPRSCRAGRRRPTRRWARSWPPSPRSPRASRA
jgi:6-phosphogluconate dehydrogenase-like protein